MKEVLFLKQIANNKRNGTLRLEIVQRRKWLYFLLMNEIHGTPKLFWVMDHDMISNIGLAFTLQRKSVEKTLYKNYGAKTFTVDYLNKKNPDYNVNLKILGDPRKGIVKFGFKKDNGRPYDTYFRLDFTEKEFDEFMQLLKDYTMPNASWKDHTYAFFKRCMTCEKLLETKDFNRCGDGYQAKCKVCDTTIGTKYYHDNIHERGEYGKQYRVQNADRLAEKSRNYRQENLEKSRKISRDSYARNVNNRNDYINEYRRRNKNRIKAQTAVRDALRSGFLVRPINCEVCGNDTTLPNASPIRAHHHSYMEKDWLNVTWLCERCHKRHEAQPQPHFCLLPKEKNRLDLRNLVVR